MAMFGEGVLCTPVAGLIASIFMFVVSQSRTMSRLGRMASILSLIALFIVVCQCLYAVHYYQPPPQDQQQVQETNQQEQQVQQQVQQEPEHNYIVWKLPTTISDLFRQLSALGSIGFAMGSQKLFLNIRKYQPRPRPPPPPPPPPARGSRIFVLNVCQCIYYVYIYIFALFLRLFFSFSSVQTTTTTTTIIIRS